MKNKVLILGKIPPPIGGVTVHVSRLVQDLSLRSFDKFDFYDLRETTISIIFFQIFQYKVIHLHASNPYFQLIVAVVCRLTNKRLIITYHGNWGRYGFLKNFITGISARLTLISLVQNEESFLKAKKWNNNVRLMSAFITPVRIVPLSDYTLDKLLDYKKRYKYLFCTNAWKLTFDKYGNETYGISTLIMNISKAADSALIISDPSGTYHAYLLNHLKIIPDNTHFITEAHDFWNVLKLSDAFVRNTTTDGDSISIHEAIHCKIIVFATACVTRPLGCILYNDILEIDLSKKLEEEKANRDAVKVVKEVYDTTGELILLYNSCLS